MSTLLKRLEDLSRAKLAGVTVYHANRRSRSTRKPRKKSYKIKTTEAVVEPKGLPSDVWETQAGRHVQGAAVGAGTASGLGWAAGGMHWSGKTPLGLTKKQREKAYKFALKRIKDKSLDAAERAKWSRRSRWLALAGAGTGAAATAAYSHAKKKHQKQLKDMPKQLVVKIPTKNLVKSSGLKNPIKDVANKLKNIKQPKVPKPNKVSISVKKPPGPSQLEQAVKVTASPIKKTAAEKATYILNRLRSL